MIGITFYPQKEQKRLLSENAKGLEIEVEPGKTFQESWKNLKTASISDIKFIVHKDLESLTRTLIKQIQEGKLNKEELMYNNEKLFDLLCSYTHIRYNKRRYSEDEFKQLRMFTFDIVKQGANLEEIKLFALSSLFFNIDPLLDREGEDYSVIKSKMDFTMRLAKTIDILELSSPYDAVFSYARVFRDDERAKDNTGFKQDFDFYCKEFKNYDVKNLEYIAKCKLKNSLMQSILKYRYSYMDINNNALAQNIFEPRTDVFKARGAFLYEINDDTKEDMMRIINDKEEDKFVSLANTFYDYGLISEHELYKFDAAKQVLSNCYDYYEMYQSDERDE